MLIFKTPKQNKKRVRLRTGSAELCRPAGPGCASPSAGAVGWSAALLRRVHGGCEAADVTPVAGETAGTEPSERGRWSVARLRTALNGSSGIEDCCVVVERRNGSLSSLDAPKYSETPRVSKYCLKNVRI